ncbi:MAG: sugar transferase, partial [Ruthenibacterium sp.]
GKYNTTPYDKLQMDLIYIAGQSIIEDLRLILMTVKVLFMPESTEGVGEGQETAKKAKKSESKIDEDYVVGK